MAAGANWDDPPKKQPPANAPITENGITDDFGSAGIPHIGGALSWGINETPPAEVKQFKESLVTPSDSEFAHGGTIQDDKIAAPQVGPQTTLSAGPGTGFVNIDRYIGANQDVARNLNSARDKALIGNANAFESSVGQVRGTASQGATKSSLNSSMLANGLAPNGYAFSDLGGKGPSGGSLKSYFDPGFGGSTTAGDMPRESADVLAALSNSRTAGREIAKEQGVTGQYNPALASIDAAIYGQGAGGKAVANVGQAAKTQGDYQSKTKSGLESSAKDALNQQSAITEKNKNVARQVAQGLINNPAASKPGSPEAMRLKMISDALGESYQAIAPATAIAPAATPVPQVPAPAAQPKNTSGVEGVVPGQTYVTDYQPSSQRPASNEPSNYSFGPGGGIRIKSDAEKAAEKKSKEIQDTLFNALFGSYLR